MNEDERTPEDQAMTQPGIPPAPVPTLVGCGPVPMQDGSQLVMIVFQTHVGSSHFFLTPESAEELSQRLSESAERARLSVPPGLLVTGGPETNGQHN